MCYQCRLNKGRPHICAEAQVYGETAKCCNVHSEDGKMCAGCFSFREIAIETSLQWGDNPPELYLQAILNSSNMKLD